MLEINDLPDFLTKEEAESIINEYAAFENSGEWYLYRDYEKREMAFKKGLELLNNVFKKRRAIHE